ncbi:coenzyme F420-0:L-glutamate ligase [Patescibacteria group bacterium]|nr:coenzyme F420-0:L-glutamate ligase [Patescibacteria group bacterium]
MEFLPVMTRVLLPPQDDLRAVLKESLPPLRERDIVVISSKVVAIHEGRCVAKSGFDKNALIKQEAELVIPRGYAKWPLVVSRHAFVSGAGIDESNGNGYHILLPEDVFKSAQSLHEHLCVTYGIADLGIIITDSASAPFRYGAQGVALSWWGMEPLQNHIGRTDLFGREIRYERSNVVDGIAGGATVVGGEVDEATPIVIVRGVPRVTFVAGDTRDQLLAPFSEDRFRVLYEEWLPKD